MSVHTLARPTHPSTVAAQLQASRCEPVIALALLVARRLISHQAAEGEAILLEGWADLAAELLRQAPPNQVQHARRQAQRAIRIVQGYESAARDKAYQCLHEYLEGAHGVDRELTDEECVALNNGLLHAFAGYAAYLDHVAGAIGGME